MAGSVGVSRRAVKRPAEAKAGFSRPPGRIPPHVLAPVQEPVWPAVSGAPAGQAGQVGQVGRRAHPPPPHPSAQPGAGLAVPPPQFDRRAPAFEAGKPRVAIAATKPTVARI